MEQNFNHVLLCGQVLTQPQPSHVNHSQSFSRFLLSVPRLSGQEDCLPVIVPSRCWSCVPCPRRSRHRHRPASLLQQPQRGGGHGWWCRSLPRPSSPVERGR